MVHSSSGGKLSDRSCYLYDVAYFYNLNLAKNVTFSGHAVLVNTT